MKNIYILSDNWVSDKSLVEMFKTDRYNVIVSELKTPQEALAFIDKIVADKDTRVIVQHVDTPEVQAYIGNIRKSRKDIFVVGFNNTMGESADKQYLNSLEFLKNNSLNLVVSKDKISLLNMIVAPEETRYAQSIDVQETLSLMVKMTLSRIENHFTRSTVIEGTAIDWNGPDIPDALRIVVNHCIENGAYKPFMGKTAGHFAAKLNDREFATSIRKSNFNELDKVGLVKIVSKNQDEVIAHGFKPSVGGQSQRQIFTDNPDTDSIVHFHCPVKEEFKDFISVAAQWPNECGSHECGQNTSRHLKEIDLGDGDTIKVVFLDDHGPNIVFNRKVNPYKVTKFIDKHFDLSVKTGGFVV